jgi:hypothetical protein
MTAAVLAAGRPDAALRVAAVVALVVFVGLLTFVPVASNDLWLQEKIGQMIIENGEIPRTVLFPFTPVRDNVFNAHEWLPSIVFHLFDKWLGHERLIIAQGLIGMGQFALCLVLARRLSHSLAVGLLLTTMAMLVANYRYHLRPEIFALLLLVVLLHVLTVYRAGARRWVLAWCLPIAVIWANSHGSFLLGPVVCAIFAVGEAGESLRRSARPGLPARLLEAARVGAPYAIAAGGMFAASIANPLGIELPRFALTLSGSEVTKTFIDEWSATLSPRFMTRLPFALFIGAMSITLAVAALCRRSLTMTDGLLLAAFALLAFQRTRFVVLFGFVALPVCARLIGAWPARRDWEGRLLAAGVGVGVVGIALVLPFGNVWGAYPFISPSSDFTAPMIERLSRLQGNVFNSYELGAELIYRDYPRLRPSMDSRIDSYGDTYFLLHQRLLVDEPQLKSFVAAYDVRYMLLLWREFEQLKKLKGLRDSWRVQFADHKMVLLERVDASPPPAGTGPP